MTAKEMKVVFLDDIKVLAEKWYDGEIDKRTYNKRSGEIMDEVKPKKKKGLSPRDEDYLQNLNHDENELKERINEVRARKAKVMAKIGGAKK